MTLNELKTELGRYMYMEDTGMIDVALGAIIATRLGLGRPIWMVLIGSPSSGKSQILRPLAMTDAKFMHQVDDLTENTFLSGMRGKKNEDGGTESNSLLDKIGKIGIIVMSDLTVLFSKNTDSRNAILSQFRMIYDGKMTKHSGNSSKAIEWEGKLGVIAGSTPSIYRHFEEVADMGERFIYYRLRDDSEASDRRSMEIADERGLQGWELDKVLSGIYEGYIRGVVEAKRDKMTIEDELLSKEVRDKLMDISSFTEKIRTPVQMDWKGEVIDRIPVAAKPVRTYLQLRSLALAMQVICRLEGRELGESEMNNLIWCAYSLANEEKRACLKVLCGVPFSAYISTSAVADIVGLPTGKIRTILQTLAAVGVLERNGTSDSLIWRIPDKGHWQIIRDIEKVEGYINGYERTTSKEDVNERREASSIDFDKFVKDLTEE